MDVTGRQSLPPPWRFPWWAVVPSLLLPAGCGDPPNDPEPVPIPVAAPVDDAASDGPASEPYEKQLSGIRFTIPAGWQEVRPRNSILQAEFQLPGEAGPARLTLSSAGGSIDENIQRWIGQFQPGPDDPAPETSTIEIDGTDATRLDAWGTYYDGFAGAGESHDGWRMLGVVIPLGPQNFFVKLTGPADTVAAREAEMKDFLRSGRIGN